MKSLPSSQKVADLLYKTYPDILNKVTTPENQLINLINKIIAHKKSKNYATTQISPTNKNVNPINTMEVFPKQNMQSINTHNQHYGSGPHGGHIEVPEGLDIIEIDDGKKIDYTKSNQNFFSTGKNMNINFVDQTYPDQEIKDKLQQFNKHNRYVDEEKEDVNFYKDEDGKDLDINLKLSSKSIESNSNKRVARYID